MCNRVYLNVSYLEKEEVKKLGAKWNPERKQWYYIGKPEDYIKFAKWLFNIETHERIMILCDYVYIIEGKRECWKCGKETKVIGIGIEKFIEIYDTDEEDEEGNPIYGIKIQGFDNEKELYIGWCDEEKEIPSFLLKYLKENYTVKTGFSRIAGRSFANHCEHCGAIQGNNYIFDEFDTPFSLTECNFEKNIEKIKELKIKKIKLKENIGINFSYGISGDEYLYLKYGKVEEITIEN